MFRDLDFSLHRKKYIEYNIDYLEIGAHMLTPMMLSDNESLL